MYIAGEQDFLNARFDVVVIGAGPSGSSAAAEMAKRGLDVLMVEKDEFPGKSNVCGGGILETRLVKDLDLEPSVIDKEIFDYVYFFPWGIVDRRSSVKSISFLRRVFDNSLAQRAVRVGVKLNCLTLVTGVAIKTGNVRVYLRRMNTGEPTAVIADLVIFADGPSSLAYKSFGLGFSRTRGNTALGAIYELEWKNNPLDCFEFYFDRKVSPWGYGWIFPKRNVVNVGVCCLLSKLRRNIRQHLNYLVNEHPIASKKLAGRKALRFAAALIPIAPARKTVGHRMLVVGDAAGMVDPIWGGGIITAIRSGRIAGRIATKAFNESNFSKDFLKHEWKHEWKKTKESRYLQYQYLKSRIMLVLSSVDREAYIRLQGLVTRIPQSRFGRLFARAEGKIVF
jgi:digeranylgeranylglycerophospholipid reductase